MAVKRIDTLGCHPLVLMKKLAAIGGLEILKEEKHVHDGVEYPYHIVAKVKDGLYVEAKDPLYEQAITPERLPQRADYTGKVKTAEGPLKLECTQAMFQETTFPNERHIVILSEDPLAMEAYGASALVSVNQPYDGAYVSVTCVENGNSGNSGTYLFGGPVLPSSSGAVLFGKDNAEKNLSGFSFNKAEDVLFDLDDSSPDGTSKGVRLSFGTEVWDGFGVCMNTEVIRDITWKPVYLAYPNYNPQHVLHLGTQDRCAAVVISGTVFRVSSQISEDSLVTPSEWETLPCAPIIINNDAGLFFCYNSGSAHSGMVGAVTVDTSKGNDMEGSFPAIYDSGVFCGVHATGGEKLYVLGSPSNPAGTVVMQLFAPSPPISTDSVSGGPVVTDLFAYTSEEIRGAIPGVLATPEALAVGSVGWLDGKRYRVHLPGRMLQIG